MKLISLSFCMALFAAHATLLDRIAVTVSRDAITESEVLEELRVTAFLNGTPLDFSPAARRAAAERLVDQYLIRNQMSTGAYAQPNTAKGPQALRDFVKSHFRSQAEFEEKLKQYGLNQDEVEAHLLFQLAVVQFTNLLFAGQQSETASHDSAIQADGMDAKFDSWLKQLRSQVRVEFKKEAFE
jgi:hypothetical protein